MKRRNGKLATASMIAAVLVGCATPAPVPLTPPREAGGAAVVRKPITEPAPASASASSAKSAQQPAIVVPAGSQYACVSEVNGERQTTAIVFSPKVAALCQRHPEMGVCQYERDLCRRSGGRVYAANGVEITHDTEAEYDRRVMRVRFQAN
jgi:hypothetical protein